MTIGRAEGEWMYNPPAFAVDDRIAVHRFIDRYNFGVLTSLVGGELFATHLPWLLDVDPSDGTTAALVAHLAKANPHAAALNDANVLVVFSGPHAYISPSWYAAEQVVPTWNYQAVHATGRATIIDRPEELMESLERLRQRHEDARDAPWTFDATSPFIERLATQIVGVRVTVQSLEGKWKLSQNHPEERRRRVITALRQQDDEDARAIADAMEATLPPDPR